MFENVHTEGLKNTHKTATKKSRNLMFIFQAFAKQETHWKEIQC